LPLLTAADLRKQIASGKLGTLYLIRGSDEEEKDLLARAFVGFVEPDLQAFNVDRLRGGETDAHAVVNAARTLPLLAPRRIVLVVQAERLLMPKKKSEASASEAEPSTRELEPLERYIAAPVESSTVVFIAGDLNDQRRIVKLLSGAGGVVRCSGPTGIGDAERWVRQRVTEQGTSIEPRAARELAERARVDEKDRRVDLTRLRADVDRLALYAAGRKTISLADVNDVIGDANALNVFAVTRAIERGAAGEALRELALLMESGAVPYAVLGGLAWFARARLPAGRVAAAVEAVFRTDLLLKTSTGDPRAILERLVVELCGR
jgi:DNA polymerase-3 subunit delta